MTHRFQFSLGRLLACLSALCVAAAAFTNGISGGRDSKSGVSFLIGWLVGGFMSGAGVGFLVSNRVVVAFLAAVAAFVFVVVPGLMTGEVAFLCAEVTVSAFIIGMLVIATAMP